MLKDKLAVDLKAAQKEGDANKRDILRLLLSALQNEEIEAHTKGKEVLSDEDVIRVLQREAKKRKESIAAYQGGKRDDLAAKEEEELHLIEEYLPEAMPEKEIEKIVKRAIEEIKPQSPKDFGRVMAEAMKRIAGRADGALVKRVVESCMKQEA